MTIRKFNHWFTSDQLIASGSLPVSVRDIVIKLMVDRKNGIISGGTGSGKTTLMKALLDHVPQHERLVVIEQPAELKISQPNAIRWEAVEAIPGQVAITPSQLLAAALRHRPDRIIMGEIRDECGYDLLQRTLQILRQLILHRDIVDVCVPARHLRPFVAQVPLDDVVRNAEIDHARSHRVAELVGLEAEQLAGGVTNVVIKGEAIDSMGEAGLLDDASSLVRE